MEDHRDSPEQAEAARAAYLSALFAEANAQRISNPARSFIIFRSFSGENEEAKAIADEMTGEMTAADVYAAASELEADGTLDRKSTRLH